MQRIVHLTRREPQADGWIGGDEYTARLHNEQDEYARWLSRRIMHKYATKISLMLVLLTPNSKIYVHYYLFVKMIKFLVKYTSF